LDMGRASFGLVSPILKAVLVALGGLWITDMWQKIRLVLGALTDLLLLGRKGGLWSEKQGPLNGGSPHHDPFKEYKK
jgi:hypothetical protein